MSKIGCDCGSDHARDEQLRYFHPAHECQNFGTDRLMRADGQFGPRLMCPPCAAYLVRIGKFARIGRVLGV